MTSNRSLFWMQFLRTSAVWLVQQVLGVLGIVASVALDIAVAQLAANMASRWGWDVVATAVGALGWLVASLIALYSLSRFLRLRRQRTVSLWLLLSGVYLVLVWAVGGLPLIPRLLDLGAPPAAAAERPLMLGGGPSAALPAPTASPSPTRAPSPTATPLAAAPSSAAAAPALPLWAQNADTVTLYAAPDPDADSYNSVPAGSYFRILGATDSRYKVYYGGDRARRRPGEAWVDKTDLLATDPPQFAKVRQATILYPEASARGRSLATVPRGAYVEIMRAGPDDWARVLYLGDGRDNGPFVGWLTVADLGPSDVDPPRIARFTATAAALARPPEVWLKVPYRSQLDGTPWAAANCGPTSVSMILEAHGVLADPTDVRREVMALQGTQNCTECGSFIESLATAVEEHGLKALGLTGDDGKLRRWSLDDVRAALRAGHPVLPQVMYRQLPGREDVPYWGDHYIVVTGIEGDFFLYNDPIDDGPGYGRLISAEQLSRAMGASDFPFAAFAAAAP
ncbi:MAG TPA: C39 family peptidase [Chloroflexota bacterium]|nr:C39 family peptidase [Chloroflexota bacterium]